MPPRRRPTQERSRATVARILDAAAEVLAAEGYAGASTNAIARRAAVSPGTLYQYFPDKDAIVEELVRRLVADFEAALTPVLRRAAALDPPTFTRALVDAVLDALERDADLLRAIVDRVPAADQSDRLAAIRTRLADAVVHVRVAERPDLPPAEAEAVAWLVLETAQHLAIRFVLDRPPIARDVFVDTLLRVITALAPPARA